MEGSEQGKGSVKFVLGCHVEDLGLGQRGQGQGR